LFFIQNYISGFGWALYGVSWSLAIEEHFYFGFGITLYYSLKYKLIKLSNSNSLSADTFIKAIIIIIMILCFFLRIAHNIMNESDFKRNFTMTHLRIDSLLMGVLVSYYYYFRNDVMRIFYTKYKIYLIIVPLFLLGFTPFIEPLQSFFTKTIGFSMVYIAFGLILFVFLLSTSVNKKLNYFFGNKLVDYISRIGVDSYAIYISHAFVLVAVHKIYDKNFDENQYISFTIYFFLSIYSGRFISLFIESYFLKLREKYFPNRI
jgi:peptidoglycan/LPS O-acetylase OafA/YrhL